MDNLIGKTIGDHKVLRKLGKGGMGVVYKAEQVSLGRTVAMKVLPYHLTGNAALVERFMNEARAMAALNHPNIVQIHNVGQQDRIYYYTMEFVDGISIDKLLRRKGTLPVDHAANIVMNVVAALSYMHTRGMMHRDIKSSNIMISRAGTVKLGDFGLALQEGTKRLTAEGGIIGTPEYMAPEQAAGEGATALSDIYSLGVVFYELLTGRLPFLSEAPLALLKKIQTEEPIAPRLINPEIPAAVEKIILKMMAKNPADRYQNCEDLLRELTEFQVEKTVLPFIRGLIRPRRRRVVMTGIAVIVLLLAGTAISLFFRSGRLTAGGSVSTKDTPTGNVQAARLSMNTTRGRVAFELIPVLLNSATLPGDRIEITSVEAKDHGAGISGLIQRDAQSDASTRFSRFQINLREHCPDAVTTRENGDKDEIRFHTELPNAAGFVNCMALHPTVKARHFSLKAWQLAERRRRRGDFFRRARISSQAEQSYRQGEELYIEALKISGLEESVRLLREDLNIPPYEPLLPDVIILKNGGQIRCEIIEESPDSVRIQTGTGSAEIPGSRIQSLRRATPNEIEKLSTLRSELAQLGELRDDLASANGNTKSFNIKDVVGNILDRK